MKSKNAKSLESFVDYCTNHPEERFWQALRNWSGHQFVFVFDDVARISSGEMSHFLTIGMKDTFYTE